MALPISCINSHEGWIYTIISIPENTATLLDEPLVLVLFILKLGKVWQSFSASAFNFVSYKPGTWTVY